MENEILSIRTRLGIRQNKFAELIGVRANTVYRWEKGRANPSELALAAARLLESNSNSAPAPAQTGAV